MKLKLNQNGTAVVRNGMPVYVHADGREEEFDAPAAMKLAIGKHFETSKVAGGLKIPHEIAAAAFGDSFRIENGQLVAYSGEAKMYSHSRHGEHANFDEALAQLIERYPNKAMILGEPGAATAKGAAPAGQQRTGSTITRSQFDALPPTSRAQFLKDGGRVGDAASGSAPAPAPAPASQPAAGKTITRAQFDSTNPLQLAVFFKSGGKLVD